MQSLPSDSRYVVDKTKPDSYPGFLAAQGNDMSCRYGIHYQTAKEFSPPKAKMFAALLAQDLPSITSHRVVLERFDVYENNRLHALHAVGAAMGGGLISAALESAAHQNKNVFTTDKLIVDTRPAADREREGTIPGAIWVERNVLEWRLDPRSDARLSFADSYDLEVIVTCQEGYTSSLAAASLRDLGLRRATDLAGGFAAWRAAGLPVTPGAP